jgi:hypothetical protein
MQAVGGSYLYQVNTYNRFSASLTPKRYLY